MTIVNERHYTLDQVRDILGISSQKLFEVLASPSIEKMHYRNHIYLSKDTVKQLINRRDV